MVLAPSTDHPFYKTPAAQQQLWRYMDLVKLLALIDAKSLFFPSAVSLDAADHFEGSVSSATRVNRDKQLEHMMSEFRNMGAIVDSSDEARTRRQLREHQRLRSEILRFERKWTFISCWHMNDCESAAMWKLYSSNSHGVAIQTTYDRLCSALDTSEWKHALVGEVKYIDYQTEAVAENWSLAPFFFKRRSFAHERELRVVIQELPTIPHPTSSDKTGASASLDWDRKAPTGIEIPANIGKLIEKVYVSPDAPPWLDGLTSRILSKYELDCAVVKSSMIAPALY